jgi:hypothetical protein
MWILYGLLSTAVLWLTLLSHGQFGMVRTERRKTVVVDDFHAMNNCCT